MRYLLPLVASSALVAALPQVKTVIDTVVVTATQYVEESAPTGTSDNSPAIPYFPAPAAPSVAYSATPVAPVAPVVASSPAPVAAQAAAVPSKQVDTPKPAQVSTPAYTSTAAAATPSKPSVPSNPGSKDGQSTQGQSTSQSVSSSDSILAIMTNAQVEAIVHTCWNGAIPWPIPNTPLPCVDVVAPQLSLFPRPAATPNMITVNNYCGYDIHYDHFSGASSPVSGTWKAGTKGTPMAMDGTVFKAGKTPSSSTPVLIEYGVNGGQIFYDLSLINCINDGDTSNCAGHEAGLQIGGPNSMTFQCAAGAWCDDQVYMYQENLCKKQNPVSSTSTSNGLTVEFCASQKK